MTVPERELGEELRTLRLARGLSLGVAAERAGLSKSALAGWESGRSRPRGSGFARLLDSLEAEPRPRARLLHAADPQFAQFALADTALGAPVDLGAVIRAMRLRRGMTQAEVARAAGVTQATVARWESGDTVPSGATLHTVAHALGASPEEGVALVCTQGVASGMLPDAPFGSLEAMNLGFAARLSRGPLYEVMSLGLEAELWPRAVRDARWDPALAFVAGDRAVRYFLAGRLGEAEATARRGLRLPPTPLVRLAASFCFSALLEVATHGGTDPATLAEKIAGWTARLPEGEASKDRLVKPWMRWEQALRLGETGRADEGLALIGTDLEREGWENAALEIEVRAGRADRAERLLETYIESAALTGPQPDIARFRVRIAHLRQEAADEATLQAMREEWHPWPEKDDWYTRHKLERIECEQTRLAASR